MANIRIRIALPVEGGGKQAALPANRPTGSPKSGAVAKPPPWQGLTAALAGRGRRGEQGRSDQPDEKARP